MLEPRSKTAQKWRWRVRLYQMTFWVLNLLFILRWSIVPDANPTGALVVETYSKFLGAPLIHKLHTWRAYFLVEYVKVGCVSYPEVYDDGGVYCGKSFETWV